MTYLTLGTLWKNELPYALDFVKYHKYVGVEKFIIFDREYHQVAELFKNDPSVKVVHYPEGPGHVHAQAWADLIGMASAQTKWLALIDADQCLVPEGTHDVKEILKEYEPFAALQINWSTFGSGGNDLITPGAMYERFTKRARLTEGVNAHCQFICQPARTLALRTHDPHHPRLPPNEMSVNTNKDKVIGPFSNPPRHNKLWVAHYINKSREEFLIKNGKGRADIFAEKMPSNLFDEYERFCNAEDEFRVLNLWRAACENQKAI